MTFKLRGFVMKWVMLLLFFILYPSFGFGFYIDKIDKTPCNLDRYADESLPIHKFFKSTDFEEQGITVNTDPLLLQHVVRDAIAFFDRYKETHHAVLAPSKLAKSQFSSAVAYTTLKYIDQIIEQDKKNGGPYRICDDTFLRSNFGFLRWHGEKAAKHAQVPHVVQNEGAIKLTHYLIYKMIGSYKKTKKYAYPLFSQKDKTQKITLTKQEIIQGSLLNQELVEPMVWVTREALEEAMMQGTIILQMPDGIKRAFNVDTNNGYHYERHVPRDQQKIYWFFRELTQENVQLLVDRSFRRKNVLFAGDLYHIGFGKIVAISYINKKTNKQTLQLGVIGDTGGAFIKNAHHLDLFCGIYADKLHLKEHLKIYPDNVQAYLLYKKSKAVRAYQA